MSNLDELIKSDDFNGVRKALEADPSLAAGTSDEAPSPILLAVYYGRREIANLLREQKKDLTIQEAAAMGDQHELQRLAGDRDLNEFSGDGFFPLGYACYFGHYEAARMLLDAGARVDQVSQNPLGVTALHAALSNGHKEIAKMLVERGASVDIAQEGEGFTPLHYCAYAGDRETAELILDHSPHMDARDNDGRTAADLAEERGFTDLAEVLRPKGA